MDRGVETKDYPLSVIVHIKRMLTRQAVEKSQEVTSGIIGGERGSIGAGNEKSNVEGDELFSDL